MPDREIEQRWRLAAFKQSTASAGQCDLYRQTQCLPLQPSSLINTCAGRH